MSRVPYILTLLLAVVAPFNLSSSQAPVATGSITVDLSSPGAAIPPTLYGIFFEEISHAGDGGLYAELIQNRGFEDANLPPACVLEDGFIVPPRTPHFDTGKPNEWRLRWDVKNPHPALDARRDGRQRRAHRARRRRSAAPNTTPHSLEIDIATIAPGGRVALRQRRLLGHRRHGRRGVPADVSPPMRPIAFRGPIVADARARGWDDARQRRGHPASAGNANGWQKFEAALRATATDPKARLALTFPGPGRMWLDMVSLFPAQTFKNRPNGLRPDLAQMIADLKPGFIRGPGGCFAEGITIESRPQWKRSLGPLEDAPRHLQPVGLLEHRRFRVPRVPAVRRRHRRRRALGRQRRRVVFVPQRHVPARRGIAGADSGHARRDRVRDRPADLQVGRRAREARASAAVPAEVRRDRQRAAGRALWRARREVRQAIKAKYPADQDRAELVDLRHRPAARSTPPDRPIDIVDEHAYKAVNWAIENFDSFAKYTREGWDLYIGEFATNAGVGRGNWIAALNDAAYMMSVEKNTDLVKMASYAPLLENVNHRDWEVNMIHFDSSRVFARATYYVQQAVRGAPADVGAEDDRRVHAGRRRGRSPGRVGVGTWNTAAEFRDMRVERDGKRASTSRISPAAPRGWSPVTGRGQGSRGTWSTVGGRVSAERQRVGFSYLGGCDRPTTHHHAARRARSPAPKDFWCLAARWTAGASSGTSPAGTTRSRRFRPATRSSDRRGGPHRIETGRWYDLRARGARPDRARLSRRGAAQRSDVSRASTPCSPSPAATTAPARSSSRRSTPAPDAAAMTVDLQNVRHFSSSGRLLVMSSPSPEDENSFEAPKKIVPVERPLTISGPRFTHELPPYSLSILRIGARQQ